jgi:hypothetical protein
MAGLIDDMSGQWISLSGLTISLSLIVVGVLINQAAITGYYSSHAALEFPKNQIRELVTETQESTKGMAQLAWELNHSSNETVYSNFRTLINNYSEQVNTIYAVHGMTVNITLSNDTVQVNDTYTYPPNIPIFNPTNSTSHKIENIRLNLSYNDGTTRYALTPEKIEMRP